MPGKKKDEQGKALKGTEQSPIRTPKSRSADIAPEHAARIASGGALNQELTDLYRATAGQLYRFALLLTKDPSLAQDAVHETFLKYYLQRKRGEIPEERAWLYRVLRNYVIDQQKSAGSRKSVSLEEAHESEDKTQSPHKALEISEAMQLVLEVLSPREFQCLQLRAEGFSYREIAEILDINSGTVGALLARGSEKIRNAFGEEGLPCEAT